MADEPWLLKEDGYLNVDTTLKQIIYHPSLNVILICSDQEVVHVLDVNSGVVLQSSRLSAQDGAKLTCRYLTGQDRVLFCDGYGLGVRSDYNGVLLLDTILQKPVQNPRDVIKLELLLSEAILLKQNLILMSQFVIDQQSEVINELCDKIAEAQKQSKKGIKAQKWNTVCVELPLEQLKRVAEMTVTEFTLKNQHVPELAVAAAVQERLSELLAEPPTQLDRSAMASEARRRDTFSKWPHMDYKWALPDQMAQAGFYHQPNSSGDDRAMCFTCTVCLVCWERTDEPWAEHERHSPSCPFVCGEYTQNVPLSVTHATQPAQDATYRGVSVSRVGTTGVSSLVVTANSDGLVTVYDVSGKLRRTHSFYVTQYDSPILECCMQEFGHNYSWSNPEEGRSVTITSVSVIGEQKGSVGRAGVSVMGAKDPTSDTKLEEDSAPCVSRPAVLCGLTIRGRAVSEPKPHDMLIEQALPPDTTTSSSCLCLVLYDFSYSKEAEREPEPTKPPAPPAPATNMSNIVISMINDMDYNLMDASNSFINEYQALKMLKQTETNNYQNLIPGESDDIFLPPAVVSQHQHQGPQSQSQSGTRVLVVDDEEPDAAGAHNFQFLNGDALAKPDKSISDHISDLKSSKNKKLNYSHAVQCIALPQTYKNQAGLEVWEILPTRGCTHVLVVLRSEGESEGAGSVLLVYEVLRGGAVARLRDVPSRVRDLGPQERPLEASLVPAPADPDHAPLVVLVCADGATRVYDIDTLRVVSIAKLDNTDFVSAVYCNSLERLCLATSNSLHFFPLLPPSSPGASPPLSPAGSLCELSAGSGGVGGAPAAAPPPLCPAPAELSVPELRALRRLTEFEALGPAQQCCVSVPPCWSEMQQQRQRRHDDAAQRTWRLQTDTTTWDEHIFEITLPWAVQLGHMDLHFTLHGLQPSVPHVEVTLLRQNTSGIGHRGRTEVHFQVDDAVPFECLQRAQNPVTSREYLRSHNADLLAGPVNLAHSLDLSEHSGKVTLTSPKLFNTNTRTLLLHIKALCDPSKEPPARKDFKRGHTTNKTEYLGCDCLHELSITMYRARADTAGERAERTAMLESGVFLAGLVRAAATAHAPARQHAALDLLLWLAAVRLAPARDAANRAPQQQQEALQVVEQGMQELLTKCLIQSGRSIAHKCVKLMVICSEGARNISESIGRDFDSCILRVLQQLIPDVCGMWSAGALHWLVALALRVSPRGDSAPAPSLAPACLQLLRALAAEMARRQNPHHLLLRARFGLWGTPLEPELFELEPPPTVKPSSQPVTYSTVVSEQPPHVFSEGLEAKDVFVPPGGGGGSSSAPGVGGGKGARVLPSKHMRGLLETEPLHFSCVATSDGTRVERFDAAAQQHPVQPPAAPPPPAPQGPIITSAQPLPPHPAKHTTTTTSNTTAGKHNKKDDDMTKDLFMVNKDKENVTLTELDFNMASTSTPTDLYPKEITQLLLNADTQKTGAQEWPLLTTNKLDVLEMTIDEDIPDPSATKPAPSWRSDAMDMLGPALAPPCPLHQLLVAPPQQVMVVERMQSGARRFVTLDFGAPVLLTDVLIPQCHDLVSLALDLWLRGPDADAVRLVLATDIGTKTLVLSDLQPPPICRYIKITTIGRYGMSTTRCKIPIGNFYGHLLILPDEAADVEGVEGVTDVDGSVALLGSLLEDVHCRYSLACARLTDLLQPLLAGDIANAQHMATYMHTYNNHQDTVNITQENQKVFAAYGEAIMYQRQLNIVQGVMKRIERAQGTSTTHACVTLADSCTDKLRVLAEALLDIVLSAPHDLHTLVDRATCHTLFHGLCVPHAARLQTLTAALLVRACGRQPYWGDFIADTIRTMYTTNYTRIFPLDRVFMLLTYLGKKSPERGIVLDSNLRVLVQLLQEGCGGSTELLAVNSDLTLLGWVLLYCSWQLDHTLPRGGGGGGASGGGDLACVKRWAWVTGDQSARPQDAGVCTGSHRRKVHRRFIHYKQQIDQLDWTKKAVQASTQVQALSALSSQAASLSSKLEAALKQQEHVFKRIKQFSSKQKEMNKAARGGGGGAQGSRAAPPAESEHTSTTAGGVALHQLLEPAHALATAQGLVTFLLHMDHSCSSDLFLLACKVLARLVVMSRLSLAALLSPAELHTLLARCVANEPPWAQHGLACLLLDMLDTGSSAGSASSTTSATPTASTTSTTTQPDEDDADDEPGPSFTPQTDAEMFESFAMEEQLIPDKPKSNPLPSVFESDDSELDDFLDDILERGRSLLRRQGSGRGGAPSGTVSGAMDARLELGVDTGAEILLRRLTSSTSSPTEPAPAPSGPAPSPSPWAHNLLARIHQPNQHQHQPASNADMLTQCFNQLFQDMQMQPSNIENTVRLWLTLNKTSSKGVFNPSGVPGIPVHAGSVSALMSALAYSPGLTLRAWCVALQALTLMCNMAHVTSTLDQALNGMATTIIHHQDFVNLLLRLLSGSGLVFSDKGLAGPSVCRALHDLLLRLLMRCDVVSAGSAAGVRLKELLLAALLQLVQPSGALAMRHGPLDVQCKFLQTLLHLDYADANLNLLAPILESTGVLVSGYVSNIERIKCVNLGERNSSVGNNFSGLFASVLGSDSSKQDRPASWDSLLVALLKLLTRLVQTPVPTNVQPSSPLYTNTQTDEFKSCNPPPLTVADACLRQHGSVLRFLHCLTAFSSSSLAMLLSLPAGGGVGGAGSLAELGEPASLGDAVFQLLSVLVAKARDRRLVLQPLVAFLRAVDQLSEPTVWFVLKVLSDEEMVQGFVQLEGVRVLAESLVRSSRSLTALQHGTISLVMHHLSTQHAQRSDATLSYAAPSFSKKVQQANLENAEALVNFAPMGSIRCHSGTAQPADILIQSAVASHRRARTPQWCYHFYPDETHTELSIRLPCAVLLREVQLQPHLSSLSTCPSAVALEVSSGSPEHLVPACPPLPTSGMTFIRLHLPQPEVVTHVLLRLYKPRDASNIGLSQIRLLGTSAFGKPTTTADVEEEEHFTRYSLGWLRLLHHCLTVPGDGSAAAAAGVLTGLAGVAGLLQACCALLLAPSHVPALYLPQLQRVLCRLALADRPSGLAALRLLLAGRAPTLTHTHHTLCEVMQQLCTTQDANTPYRMSEVLSWLERTATEAVECGGVSDNCSPAFLSCIASILWCAQAEHVPYTLSDLLTPTLLDLLFRWSQLAAPPLKHALDALLCATTYIQPNFYPSLLQRLNVLVPNTDTSHTASISDDRKDSESVSLTDDTKQDYHNESEWYNRLMLVEYSQLLLSESQLTTIAMVSRSPPAIQQLLDSGLPKLLIKAILDFCSPKPDKVPMAHLQNITSILHFLSDVCAEQGMKDWLGSPDGSIFWLPLLQFLCKKPENKLKKEPQARLEELCVRFLSSCCLCHVANQALLARVLCEVISQQSNGISGFLRRLVLQLLLENEKVLVVVQADEAVHKVSPLPPPSVPHPSYRRSHDRLILHLNTNTSIGDILDQHVAFATTLKPEAKPKELVGAALAASAIQAAKEIWEIGIEADHVSMAAAVTAKDKRAKDAKNQSVATPQLKKKRYTGVGGGTDSAGGTELVGGRVVRCVQLGDVALPHALTLAQLLAMLDHPTADVHLTVTHTHTHSKDEQQRASASGSGTGGSDALLQHRPIGNALQVFSSMGGLALLAQHLPAVYPELVRPATSAASLATQDKASAPDNHDTDWVKVEGSDDIYEDLDDLPAPKPLPLFPNVPPHSLTSFSLFLRLPGYADILLQDWRRALCLLRLVLGVTDDGHGADIFLSAAAEALPTLPFHVLRQLYEATPLGTDDGRLLRQISVSIGVTNLLLGCLGVFTHQTHSEGYKSERSEEKSQLYWAKGTGFGTGSTQQSWNVEQALLRQRSEEEHVTVLLQVLASYMSPSGAERHHGHDDTSPELPAAFHLQLASSCLLPALSSYLRNDSVLDMARHIPLYRSVLQVLRAMATSQQLVKLLLPTQVVELLLNMKSCVDNYTCRLRFNKSCGGTGVGSKLKLGRYEADEETDEGLALLMPDIQDTAGLVQAATSVLGGDEHAPPPHHDHSATDPAPSASPEQRYLDVMRRLQFDTAEMLSDSSDGAKFVVSYHFEGNVRSAGDQSQPARVKRLAQEAVTLATSLPLSYSSSVFVRCDTDRLDIMKVLITGPADTPYANGCFELDVYFPPDYPNAPMLINLETTGHHTVRFNPNLYNDGKVCLSVLNTWHGRPEEKWNSQTSSFLQVLVSIQSLILVPEPYFNEPGYERSRGTPQGTQSSREYNTNICQATVRWAMLEQILNPCPCFRDVIHTHFWLKRHEILAQVEAWIGDLELQLQEKKQRNSSKRTTLTNLDAFKKNYHQLKEQLLKLQPPPGVQPESQSTELNDVDMEKIVNEVCE